MKKRVIRRSKMRTNTWWKRLMVVVGLGVALSGLPSYPTLSEAIAAGSMARSEVSGGPASVTALQTQAGDVITEWNQQAVTLTLLPASALSPVQQTRVMAIVQVAVHDAVNGITGKYATYLSPPSAPETASPEAAAIAAAHHTLRSLFGGQAASLDTLFGESLAAHGLS